MTRIGEYGRVWRFAALALLLLAFVGPWAMDRINVPAEFACSAPFVRLRGDYCGLPLSGVWMVSALVGELANRAGALVAGGATPADLGGTFLIILFAVPALLPFVIAVHSVLRGERRRQQLLHLLVWGMAAVWSLWFALSARVSPPIRVWGIWLYVGLACVALTLEGLALASRRRSGKAW